MNDNSSKKQLPVNISVKFTEDQAEQINQIAKTYGVGTATAVRHLCFLPLSVLSTDIMDSLFRASVKKEKDRKRRASVLEFN